MTVYHLIAITAIITGFLTSSVAEIFISHYVKWVDTGTVARGIIIKAVLILLTGLTLVYDVSDFDLGSIDWYVPLLYTAVYLIFCGFSTWLVLQPRAVLSHRYLT